MILINDISYLFTRITMLFVLIQKYNYNVIPYESSTQTATIRISCITCILKYYIVLSF